jgi:hypothetical protein
LAGTRRVIRKSGLGGIIFLMGGGTKVATRYLSHPYRLSAGRKIKTKFAASRIQIGIFTESDPALF